MISDYEKCDDRMEDAVSEAISPQPQTSNRTPFFELAVPTCKRRKILAGRLIHTKLRRSWERSRSWLAGHYTVMPDCVHVLCIPAGAESDPLNHWVRQWQRGVIRELALAVPADHFWDEQYDALRVDNPSAYIASWIRIRQQPVYGNLVSDWRDWPFTGEVHRVIPRL